MQRFAADLRSRADLVAQLKQQAGLDGVIALARAHGYAISVEDVKQYLYRLAGGCPPVAGSRDQGRASPSQKKAIGRWPAV